MKRLFVPLALAMVACAPPMPGSETTPVFDDDSFVHDDGRARRASASSDRDSAHAGVNGGAPVAVAPPLSGGHIDGGDLDVVLDAGPGAFLASVEVRPVFAGKRFRGWEITGIRAAPLAESPLRRGDMVVAVNDQGLRRPEDLQRVWEKLRGADELVVRGIRSGRDFDLRYQIVRR